MLIITQENNENPAISPFRKGGKGGFEKGLMPEDLVRGKSIAAVASDIAEGFIFLNPLILKNFPNDVYKDLYYQMRKLQTAVRNEKFPTHDQSAIRSRNLRLQRLHQAIVVLQNAARIKKLPL